MAKIAKKQIKSINQLSLFVEVIKQFDSIEDQIAKKHWTDCPPEMWNNDISDKWDMMNELEMKLKAEILKILNVEE